MNEEQALLAKVKSEALAAVESFKADYTEIATKAASGVMKKEEVAIELGKLETKSQEFTNTQLKVLNDELTKVNESLKAANIEINKLKENPISDPSEKSVGFGTLLRKSMEEAGIVEEFVVDAPTSTKGFRMKGYDNSNTKYSLKAAAIDMTSALTLAPGTDTQIGYLTQYGMKDVKIDLTKDTHVTQFMPTDPISSQYMGVLVEHEYVDGAALTKEGIPSAKSSLKFKTVEFKVFKVATHFRISKENLSDIPRLESKLNRIAPDKIMSAFDAMVLSDTGDNSETMKGIYVAGNYTPFVAATFSESQEEANVVDLIRKMKLQAYNADQDVNAVILHPTQIDEVEGLKDNDKNYLQSRGIVYDANGNLVRVHGLAIIRNKKPTTNRVTVMWSEAAEIGIRNGINFEIGLDGTDLTEGMRTIVFEFRAAMGVGKAAAIIVSSDPTGDIEVINKDTTAV